MKYINKFIAEKKIKSITEDKEDLIVEFTDKEVKKINKELMSLIVKDTENKGCIPDDVIKAEIAIQCVKLMAKYDITYLLAEGVGHFIPNLINNLEKAETAKRYKVNYVPNIKLREFVPYEKT